jgi:hypothetical protein
LPGPLKDLKETRFLAKNGFLGPALSVWCKIKGPAEIIEMIQTGPTLDVTPLLSTLINALS